MLIQVEWGVQNRPTTASGVFLLTTLFFENLLSVKEPLTDSCVNV